MPTVNELHPRAMDLAELAFSARRKGDDTTARELFGKALELEREAALLLPASADAEPSRSVLFRSAASLAYNAGEYETADWLVANGLAGYPPPEIKEELKNLYEDINFKRHLSLKGIELSDDDVVVMIEGNATAYGKAMVDDLFFRVDKLSTILYRTAERLLDLRYRLTGGVSKEIKNHYGLFINAFYPSSFAVSFQLGYPSPQQVLFPDIEPKVPIPPSVLVDEVVQCLQIFESSVPETLKERLRDEMYYENFIALAKQLAPDGDDIKVVGISTVRSGNRQQVALRKNRQQLRTAPNTHQAPGIAPEKISIETYRGVLKAANSPINTKRKYGTVRVLAEGSEHTILVPIALMKDVVQPYYEERVVIVAHDIAGKKYYDDIIRD